MKNVVFASLLTLCNIIPLFCSLTEEQTNHLDAIKNELQLPLCLEPVLHNYVQNKGLININQLKTQKNTCNSDEIVITLNKIQPEETDFGKYPQPIHFIAALAKSIPWFVKDKKNRKIIIDHIKQEIIINPTMRESILQNFVSQLKSVKQYYYGPKHLGLKQKRGLFFGLGQLSPKLHQTVLSIDKRLEETELLLEENRQRFEVVTKLQREAAELRRSEVVTKLQREATELRKSMEELRNKIQKFNRMFYQVAFGLGAMGIGAIMLLILPKTEFATKLRRSFQSFKQFIRIKPNVPQ